MKQLTKVTINLTHIDYTVLISICDVNNMHSVISSCTDGLICQVGEKLLFSWGLLSDC